VDEQALLRKYRVAIVQLKRQLLSLKDGSELVEKDRAVQDLQMERESLSQRLDQQIARERELEAKIKAMTETILVSTQQAQV